ncbi:hypothetical protein HNR16_003021 [Pseudoclavibacter chungangensis]|nr:hypothetical protein [Pseudoclavibacter chungangensis]
MVAGIEVDPLAHLGHDAGGFVTEHKGPVLRPVPVHDVEV